jgi:UDP-glucose:(heptosyl)LPS alpha-1,3-glucosyltransferase
MRYSWTGGTERYLRQIAEYLASQGHEVTIVCRSVKGERLSGVHFVLLRDFAVGGAWRQWAFAKAVERHVRAANYDVVYGLGKTWTHDVIRLGGGLHATYLESAHDATLSTFDRLIAKGTLKHRMSLRIEARALAPDAYRRVVTNCEMVKRDVMRRYSVPEDRVTVVYNGVDLNRFDRAKNAGKAAALRREFGFTDDNVVVLFLGTGYGRKGLAPVIEAFAVIAKDHPEARLMVVGFDSQSAKYERMAADLGLADKARFLGGRQDTEVCYAASDVYVLPTLYDPFANTTLEALASGLPVITTAANGASELIQPGVHGTVLGGDAKPETIADALLEWLPAKKRAGSQAAARGLAMQHPSDRTARESAAVLIEVDAQKHACTA